MNSFDFLRKLYKSAKSAVIICNTSNTIYWSTNLNKLGITDDDVTVNGGLDFFDKPIYQQFPGEYIAKINERAYTYNVKSFADRTNSFLIIEIRIESVNHSFINSTEIANLLEENDLNVRKSAGDIMSIVDNLQSKNATVTEEDYNNILNSTRQLMNSTRTLASVIETKKDSENSKTERTSISKLATKFADDCEAVLQPKNVEVTVNCVEDIYGNIGYTSFNNLCISILNRLLCISDGYLDKVSIALEMINEHSVELCISTESQSGKVRLSSLDDLKAKISKNDAIGTDLFAIKYFCEKFGAEAIQKINHATHSTSITVKIPDCDSQGVMLFKCSETLPEDFGKFSNVSIALSGVLANMK